MQVLKKVLRFRVPSPRTTGVLSAIIAAMFVAGCGSSDKQTASGDKPTVGESAKVIATSSAAANDTSSTNDSVPLGPLKGVDGVTLGGDCPDPPPGAEAEILAQASALIPLKVGLTLSFNWRAYDGDYDHECLEQVTAIDARSVLTTGSCPSDSEHKRVPWKRRFCR